ncbi:hypothetical protein GCM10008098_20850 [Rhodanobacter panaciterrae]|uniref:Uncharacterized protein n=1 Tax=Rhodanobacter panaciterrae TaxID=490572 RepID=A0ABQ2ZZN4_9GAMM|nr:hypothetical protein GCM10008098_20850 [Rhodanobacter panaciterrae]
MAPKANAASATVTTPSAANTQASGNQRSAQAALRKAARAIHPSRDAFMRLSVGDRDIVAPNRLRGQADQGLASMELNRAATFAPPPAKQGEAGAQGGGEGKSNPSPTLPYK